MDDELQPGDTVGDFEVSGVAGAGGMGTVYEAKQRSLGRRVALKVIRAELAHEPEYRERFLREARLAASIDHPQIVSVYDVGDDDGQLWLAMQWVDGRDLRSLLTTFGPRSPQRAVAIASQIAGALDAVHSVGLVHRDVKPANILVRDVDGRDHAYLTDFGVAKPPDHALDQLTRTGSVVGTAGYLSPEQIKGAQPGPRSDLYGLGCVFYEMLTGRSPFAADNELALRWAHANDPRPLVSDLRPDLGTRYDQLIAIALAVEPQDRFRSGRELAEALAQSHTGELPAAATPVRHPATEVGAPVTPFPASPTPQPQSPGYPAYAPATSPPVPERRGSPLLLILLGVLALAGIAVAGLAAGGVFTAGRATPARTTVARVRDTRRTNGATPSATRAANTETTHRTSTRTTTHTATAPKTVTVQVPSHVTETSSVTVAPASPAYSPSQPSSNVTGQDAAGYNTGPGCSDNPNSALPGCSDSPSVPSADPSRSCPGGITVDARTTSCALAESVQSNYASDGTVSGYSPERGRSYEFNCETGGPGTTGYTICQGAAGAAPLYLRWHR